MLLSNLYSIYLIVFLLLFTSFAARQFTVRLGDIDLSTDREPSAPVTFKVTEVRAHPRFSRVGFYNDIAVLVLDRPVRKSKYVIPVCLPAPSAIPSKERLAGEYLDSVVYLFNMLLFFILFSFFFFPI